MSVCCASKPKFMADSAIPILVLSLSLTVIAAAVIDAAMDCLALRRRGVNGVRKLVARQALRRNAVKLFVALLIVFIVVWSELTGQTADVGDLHHILHVRNAAVATAVLVLAVSGAWDLYDAHRLRRKVAAGEWNPPPGR